MHEQQLLLHEMEGMDEGGHQHAWEWLQGEGAAAGGWEAAMEEGVAEEQQILAVLQQRGGQQQQHKEQDLQQWQLDAEEVEEHHQEHVELEEHEAGANGAEDAGMQLDDQMQWLQQVQ